MKRILLIEDESGVVNFVKKGLTEQGYHIEVAADGHSGLEHASALAFDLIILDVMLPDISGIEVCGEMRKRGITTPILFLTILNTPENIALGLNTGADDYLIKPFKFIELIARIKALIRRAENKQSTAPEPHKNVYTICDVRVDDDAKTIERGGSMINLTATEYRLLLVLIKNKGKVLSRIDLLESVWDINFNLGTNVVDVYINYLRKKIDADHEKKLIQTVIGMGYVLKET